MRRWAFLSIAASAFALFGCGASANDRCPGCSVVLVVVDTLRADHLPCYGYPRDTAPAICGLADEALLFEDVTATSAWTKPSTASLLSGLYAKRHGALSDSEVLPDAVTILPEILASRGYSTHAFSGNGIVGPDWNFDQGYDHFVQFDDPPHHIRSDAVNARALPYLRSLDERPFFLFVHYVDPHDPYTPDAAARHFSKGHPTPDRERFERFATRYRGGSRAPIEMQIDYYDDEIRFNDRSVGELLGALGDDVVVVVTSDHGEEFFEHGAFTHRKQLFEESLRVPLLIRIPGFSGPRRVQRPISLVDVLPTLLDVLEIPVPAGLDGTSWFAMGDDVGPVFAEHRDFGRELYAARLGDEKVIASRQPQASLARYALDRDPVEQQPLRGASPLSEALLRWIDDGRRAEAPASVTAEQAEILEKLGYAEADASTP